MKALSGLAAVVERGELTQTEGTRRYSVPISRAMGARDIAQYVSVYSEGVSSARRNPVGEEVIYVVNGTGTCYIDGYSYPLAPGTAVYVPPGSVYQIENLDERGRGVSDLEIVSVCCPEDDDAETGIEPIVRAAQDTKPFRTVREDEVEALPAGDRTFKILVNQDIGAHRVTQFIGMIPPGRAPMHHHTYEEAIYIIEGEGCVHTEDGDATFKAGSSIYLPRLVSHCLENTGSSSIKLLGVFHPAGSPAALYDD
ncbi:MAG: cupin domain-containing protein [Acidobacteriota bacterium]